MSRKEPIKKQEGDVFVQIRWMEATNNHEHSCDQIVIVPVDASGYRLDENKFKKIMEPSEFQNYNIVRMYHIRYRLTFQLRPKPVSTPQGVDFPTTSGENYAIDKVPETSVGVVCETDADRPERPVENQSGDYCHPSTNSDGSG
jgi:hypothetical protein